MGNFKLLDPILIKENEGVMVSQYKSPFREFQLIQIEINSNNETKPLKFEFPYIGLVINGEGEIIIIEEKTEKIEKIKIFDSFYIIPNTEFKFKSNSTLKISLCGSH